jgi:hypothetical protein
MSFSNALASQKAWKLSIGPSFRCDKLGWCFHPRLGEGGHAGHRLRFFGCLLFWAGVSNIGKVGPLVIVSTCGSNSRAQRHRHKRIREPGSRRSVTA